MISMFIKYYRSSERLQHLYRNTSISPILRFFVNIPFFIKWSILAFIDWLKCQPRKYGCNDKRFARLKEFKDLYKGKRCFIACTGPSLTLSDLEALSNEYVFGMNSICMIKDQTSWKPDFFGIQDEKVYEKVCDYLKDENWSIFFAPYSFYEKYNTPKSWVYLTISTAYHMFDLTRTHHYYAKFSDNPYVTLYDGYSITYTLIQLAVYMGFDEIYLIGADCTYLGAKQHFVEYGNEDPTIKEATNRLYASYGTAKKYAGENGIKIFNATRGGCLELFPRVVLEEVLKDNKKNKVNCEI